ncbi:MAG: transcriptional repressor [Parasporobacterium sp.]|nr:transcriptional repressor [Parasporobacterium sp.]
MNERSKYKTKQREILVDYLQTVTGRHITVSDICESLKEQGLTIGQSTVYRQLECMVDEGLVNKYIIDGNSPACFEFLGDHQEAEQEICFHCKCEKCGRLIHLHCEELKMIQGHLLDHHRFTLNPLRTVFYGICENCRNETPENE